MSFLKNMYSGRIGRKYLLGLAFFGFIYWLILVVLAFAMVFLSVPSKTAEIILLTVGIIVDILFIFPLVVRRLHDLGKEGWIIYPYFAVIILDGIFGVFYPNNWTDIVYKVVSIGYIPLMVMATFFKGQTGPNKFGEEPARDAKFLNEIFNNVEKKDNQPASMPIN